MCQLGKVGPEGERGSGPSWWNGFSIFLFSKILNSIDFCLFHCEITRAPKIIKFFV
jgi:hypothetical protein